MMLLSMTAWCPTPGEPRAGTGPCVPLANRVACSWGRSATTRTRRWQADSVAPRRAFRERWRRVNEHEAEELRHTPIAVKWQQFCTLLEWAQQFGWTDVLREGEDEVR